MDTASFPNAGVRGDGIKLDGNDNVYIAANVTAPTSFAGVPLNGASILKYDANLNRINALDVSTTFENIYDIVIDENDTLFAVGTNGTQPVAAKISTDLILQTTGTASRGMSVSACDADSSFLYGVIEYPNQDSLELIKVDKHSFASQYSTIARMNSGGTIGGHAIAASRGIAFISGWFDGQIQGSPLACASPYSEVFGARINPSGQSFKTDETSQVYQLDTLSFDARLYPNPTTGEIWIQLDGLDKNKTVYVEAWDARGALVRKEKLNTTESIAFFDLNNCAKGIYMIRITNGDNFVFRKVSLTQ